MVLVTNVLRPALLFNGAPGEVYVGLVAAITCGDGVLAFDAQLIQDEGVVEGGLFQSAVAA